MKQRTMRRSAVLMFVLCMGIMCLFGCRKKEIAFTTGLGKKDLLKIDGNLCDMNEAMLVLYNLQRQYEGFFGKDAWEVTFGTVPDEQSASGSRTLGAYVKNQAVKQLSQVRGLSALAAEKKITLSEQEKALVEQAAEDYLGRMDVSVKESLAIDKKAVVAFYTQYCLSNKLYAALIDGVEKEISDDEARVISIQTIFFHTSRQDSQNNTVPLSEQERSDLNARASALWQQAASGENFEQLAVKNSQGDTAVINLVRGQMPEAFDDVAFRLKTGELSQLVETKDGLYIIKCLNNFLEEETKANRQVIYEKRCTDALNHAYEEYISRVLLEFNKEQWASVKLDTEHDVSQLPDLYEVYRAYFEPIQAVPRL